MLSIYNSLTLLPTRHGVPTEGQGIHGAREKDNTCARGSFIDHMLVSECLVQDRNSVTIHADDSNVSGHCAISCRVDTGVIGGIKSNVSDRKDVKLLWDKADVYLYHLALFISTMGNY